MHLWSSVVISLSGLLGLSEALLQCANASGDNLYSRDNDGLYNYTLTKFTAIASPVSSGHNVVVDFQLKLPWDTSIVTCHSEGIRHNLTVGTIDGTCVFPKGSPMGDVNITFTYNFEDPLENSSQARADARGLRVDVGFLCARDTNGRP